MISSLKIDNGYLPYIFGKQHNDIFLELGGKHNFESENPEFIDGLYGEINLITAIVGKNGTGKTSILKEIRDNDLDGINNSGNEISTKEYLKIYYSPHLEYDETDINDTVINLSKYSQVRNALRGDEVGIDELLFINNSEFYRNLISLRSNIKINEKLIHLGLPEIKKFKVKLLKIKNEDWNISDKFTEYFNYLNIIKEQERIKLEQEKLDELDLSNSQEILESNEYNEYSYKVRLQLEIIHSIILKIKSLLEKTGNKYLREGYIDKSFEEFQQQSSLSYKDALYWIIDEAYIKLNNGAEKITFPKEEIIDLIESFLECVEKQSDFDNWTELYLEETSASSLINKYQNFLRAFKKNFTYNDYPIMHFSTKRKLSSGEFSMYEIFTNMIDAKKIAFEMDFSNYLILLDEADSNFHPTWKKKYINLIVEIFPLIFKEKNIQIIFSTHDPLTLSDIPTSNIIFLDKDFNQNTIISSRKGKKTFGANISELLADSFFVEGGLIGDFAKNKIEEIIIWINSQKEPKSRNAKFYDSLSYYKKIIEIIDEKILRIKLAEMISELDDDNTYQKEILAKEIKALQSKYDKL